MIKMPFLSVTVIKLIHREKSARSNLEYYQFDCIKSYEIALELPQTLWWISN